MINEKEKHIYLENNSIRKDGENFNKINDGYTLEKCNITNNNELMVHLSGLRNITLIRCTYIPGSLPENIKKNSCIAVQVLEHETPPIKEMIYNELKEIDPDYLKTRAIQDFKLEAQRVIL